MHVRQKLTRYVLAVQYQGNKYYGFSRLPKRLGLRTVEGDLIKALSQLVGRNNFKNIQVSSRTDRGVHALSNTLHVDISDDAPITLRDPQRLRRGMNFYLSRDFREEGLCDLKRNNEVRVINAALTPSQHAYSSRGGEIFPWHARHTAIKRNYEYRLLISDVTNGDSWVPFEADRSWLFRHKGGFLNIEAMREAAKYLIGTHDFTSFQSKGCSRGSPITTLNDIRIQQTPYTVAQGWGAGNNFDNSNIISIKISGSSFLYHQVRNIVGLLAWDVGRGKSHPSTVKELLHRKSRTNAPLLAPPQGLYLVSVEHEGFSFL